MIEPTSRTSQIRSDGRYYPSILVNGESSLRAEQGIGVFWFGEEGHAAEARLMTGSHADTYIGLVTKWLSNKLVRWDGQ
jgi:hypothetical protein